MNKDQRDRLMSDLIRFKESGSGSPFIIHAIEDALNKDELTEDLVMAYESEVRRNDEHIHTNEVAHYIMRWRMIGEEIKMICGDFFPLIFASYMAQFTHRN